MPRPRALVAWSSGKDSAWALHEVRRAGAVEAVGLLTTVTSTFGRVSMHAVREDLLDAQAAGAVNAGRALHRRIHSPSRLGACPAFMAYPPVPPRATRFPRRRSVAFAILDRTWPGAGQQG